VPAVLAFGMVTLLGASGGCGDEEETRGKPAN
jgi:hypothetical protein